MAIMLELVVPNKREKEERAYFEQVEMSER
jgi:hypothetical protein